MLVIPNASTNFHTIQLELVNFITSSPLFTLFIVFAAGYGTLAFIRPFLSLLLLFADLYIFPGISLSVFGGSKDASKRSWAVVTGATDGIGKEFALQLASKGFNVFLASRSAEKLGVVAGEIESKYPGIQTKTQSIDFSAGDEASYQALASALAPLKVGVLVNNVGKSHDMPTAFHESELAEMEDIVEINVNATLRVTRLVAPGMVERRRGLILNLGSFAGAFPTPLLATYSGSKAFLIGFTQALGEELNSVGVTVQLLNTYFVVSNMSKVRRSSSMIPTPKQYVRKVLSKIGRQGGAIGRAYTATLWPAHALVDWAINHVLPSEEILLRYSLNQQVKTRSRAIAKAQRLAKAQ